MDAMCSVCVLESLCYSASMNLLFLLSGNAKRRGYFSCLLQSCWPRHLRDTMRSPESACQALCRIRKHNRLSQAETAELLGTSAATVQAWEAGRRKPSGAVRVLIQLTEQALKLYANTCDRGGKQRESAMSNDLVAAVNAPESFGTTSEEQVCQPEIIESLQTLSTVGATPRLQPISDYVTAVVTEQIESLRCVADELDRQYAVNVKKRKIRFKDRVDYLAVRERVASRIVDFAEDLCRLRSTDATGSELSGALSWNPDDDGSAASSPAAQ